jgi:hypothetical protein
LREGFQKQTADTKALVAELNSKLQTATKKVADTALKANW